MSWGKFWIVCACVALAIVVAMVPIVLPVSVAVAVALQTVACGLCYAASSSLHPEHANARRFETSQKRALRSAKAGA